MPIKEVSSEQVSLWEQLVEESPEGTIFHSFAWKRLLDAVPGWQMRLYGYFENERLLAGCCLTEKSRWGFRMGVNALATQYAGFLFSPSPGTKLADRISWLHEVSASFHQFLTTRYHYVEIHNAPGMLDVRPWIARGWEAIPRYTYVLPLDDLEELWQRLEGRIRRLIRKAEKQEFEFRSELDTEACRVLLTQSFSRHQERMPLPETLVDRMLSGAELAPCRLPLAAYSNGRMLSFLLLFFDGRRGYYSLAATASEALSTGVHCLLIWEQLKQLAEKVNEFDFLGANIASIARFKEGFNPQLRLYFGLRRYQSALLRMAHPWWRRGSSLLGNVLHLG